MSRAAKLRRAYVVGTYSIHEIRRILVRDGWHGDRLNHFLADAIATRHTISAGEA